MCLQKSAFWNSSTYSYENGKYAGSIIGDSVIIYNEIIDTTKSTSTKTIPTKTVSTKCTLTDFFILLFFLSVTKALLIAVSIYLIKHRSKQNIYHHIKIPSN